MAATGRRVLCQKSGVLQAIDSRSATAAEFGEIAIPGTYGRNIILNGDFQVAQRGTTFSTPANSTPLWDQWYTATAAANAGTHTWTRNRMFEDGSVTGAFGITHPRYYININQSVGMTTGVVQRLTCWIEDVRRFADCTMTLSFVGNADASRTLTSRMLIFYGSGGSPSATVEPTNGNVAHALTTTTTRFTHTAVFPTLSGKTIGTAGNDGLVIQFEMPISGTFQFNLWDFQLEYGSTATAFERLPFAEQLRRCQRYYCKTFDQSVTPAQNTGVFAGALAGAFATFATGAIVSRWQYPVTMRTAPSLTTYNPAAANANWRNLTVGADVTRTIEAVGDQGAIIRTGGATATSSAEFCYIHADAEAGVRV